MLGAAESWGEGEGYASEHQHPQHAQHHHHHHHHHHHETRGRRRSLGMPFLGIARLGRNLENPPALAPDCRTQPSRNFCGQRIPPEAPRSLPHATAAIDSFWPLYQPSCRFVRSFKGIPTKRSHILTTPLQLRARTQSSAEGLGHSVQRALRGLAVLGVRSPERVLRVQGVWSYLCVAICSRSFAWWRLLVMICVQSAHVSFASMA